MIITLGNFAAGYNSTISDTIAIGYFLQVPTQGNKKRMARSASQAAASKGNNTVLIGSNLYSKW